MKFHWVGTCFVVLAGALTPLPLRAQDVNTTPDVWGGNHVRMEATPQGATLEFDCAHGNMLEPIKTNAKGEFTVRGTYTPERGGPISRDNLPPDLPATYKGRIDGDTMQLEIMLAQKDRAPEPFTLTRGKVGRLVKCR